MTDLEKKRLDFLNDTVAHFNLNNRAVNPKNNITCIYSSTNKSDGCAIGRHLTPELAKEIEGFNVSNYWVYQQMPETLKELGKDFLVDIQQLHDNCLFWDEKGLSLLGRLAIVDIVEKFNLK